MTYPFHISRFAVDLATAKQPTCRCGHTATEHVTGPCQEPTRRCECTALDLICAVCRHGFDCINPETGACAVIRVTTGDVCGCTVAPPEEEPSG